jgi:hypothetical protein
MGCDGGIRHSVSFARMCKPGVPRALFHTCHLGEKASRDHLLRSMQPTKWVAASWACLAPGVSHAGRREQSKLQKPRQPLKAFSKISAVSFTQRSSARSRGRPSDRTPLSSFSSSLRFGSFACLLKSRNNPTIASSLSGRITAHMDGGDSNVLDDAGSKYRTPGHEIPAQR